MTDVLVNLEQVQKTETLEDSTGGQLPIYLLIVVGQTFSRTEKATILDRINSSKCSKSLNLPRIVIKILNCHG